MSNDTIAYVCLAAFVLFLLISNAWNQHDSRKRRADYNRKIGEPDLYAPLPSEVMAHRRTVNTAIIVLLVIIALVLTWWLWVPLLVMLGAAIG